MAYSEAAIALRRCTGTRADGEPCRAWAMWHDQGQRCVIHAGRGKRGHHTSRRAKPHQPGRVVPCTCLAYAWPHRPGAGLCRWPAPPTHQLLTPAGTHRSMVRLRIRSNGTVGYEYRGGR